MIKKFDEFVNEKDIKYKSKNSIKKVLLDGYIIQFDSNGNFKMSTLTYADMEKRNKEKKFHPIPRTFQPVKSSDFYDVEMDGASFDETIEELKKEGRNIVFEPTKIDDYTNVYIKESTKEVKESFNKLDFEPIVWGVEDFNDEAEEDNGIPVTITRFASGGRENIESDWKIYALEDLDDRWNVKAICINSEDRRYQPKDEVEFEVFKDDKIWDLESRLQDTLNEQGF